MFVIGVLFLVGGILALRVKRRTDQPNNSLLYRIDNRVVAAVAFLVGLCFLVLGFTLGATVRL